MFKFQFLIKQFPKVYEIYWNNKWPKNSIRYTMITGATAADVRTILVQTNFEIRTIGENIKGETTDDKALNCLREVVKRIEYVSDVKKHLKPEFWQTAVETIITKSGDCEDGAILLMKIMQAAGIPSWRRKLCCGDVKVSELKDGGHAYVIYLADDFNWYVLDWCYWPLEAICAFLKQPHNERTDKYHDIWWTFNEEFCWAQNDVILR